MKHWSGPVRVMVLLVAFFAWGNPVRAEAPRTFLVHLKTGLARDDAQICVAYNMIWAALDQGFHVEVLVDASAINTFKIGWLGHDRIENYRIPETLRAAMARQFGLAPDRVPRTYGRFLAEMHRRGAEFYVNTGYLMVSRTGTPEDPLARLSNKFFKPVTLPEMLKLRTGADYYMAY